MEGNKIREVMRAELSNLNRAYDALKTIDLSAALKMANAKARYIEYISAMEDYIIYAETIDQSAGKSKIIT